MEAEVRDTQFHRSSTEPDFRQITYGGGFIYSWHHFANFRPYAKAEAAYGIIDFNKQNPYHSDTRVVPYFGGGFEYHVWNRIWARADYEYQIWPSLFGQGNIKPQGVTLGASYHFGHVPRH